MICVCNEGSCRMGRVKKKKHMMQMDGEHCRVRARQNKYIQGEVTGDRIFRITCLGTRLEIVCILGLKKNQVLVLFLGTPQLLSMYQSENFPYLPWCKQEVIPSQEQSRRPTVVCHVASPFYPLIISNFNRLEEL